MIAVKKREMIYLGRGIITRLKLETLFIILLLFRDRHIARYCPLLHGVTHQQEDIMTFFLDSTGVNNLIYLLLMFKPYI